MTNLDYDLQMRLIKYGFWISLAISLYIKFNNIKRSFGKTICNYSGTKILKNKKLLTIYWLELEEWIKK